MTAGKAAADTDTSPNARVFLDAGYDLLQLELTFMNKDGKKFRGPVLWYFKRLARKLKTRVDLSKYVEYFRGTDTTAERTQPTTSGHLIRVQITAPGNLWISRGALQYLTWLIAMYYHSPSVIQSNVDYAVEHGLLPERFASMDGERDL